MFGEYYAYALKTNNLKDSLIEVCTRILITKIQCLMCKQVIIDFIKESLFIEQMMQGHESDLCSRMESHSWRVPLPTEALHP